MTAPPASVAVSKPVGIWLLLARCVHSYPAERGVP